MTASDPVGLVREVLPSGLTLLLEPDEAAQSVAAGYFVQVGSTAERAEEMGISHFLEHLMFKGSERVDAVALNERLDDLGGAANAFTSDEMTVYHAAALPERGLELLGTLTELLRPALRPADIETERRVILEEIAMYAEQPEVRLAEALRRDYWGEHPLARPILGTVQSVTALTRDDLRAYFRAYYSAAAVTLVVTGAFDSAEVLDWARRELADWPAAPLPTPSPLPAPLHPHTVRTLHEGTLSRTQMQFAAPGLPTHHPLREAAEILAELIGGENGALYWELLDTGLADSADFGHLHYSGVGIFEGGASCDPERAEEVLACIRRVLAGAADLITETAVRRAARKAAVSILLHAETPEGRLFALGLETLERGQPLSPQALAERYTRLSAADVREVLRLCPLTDLTVVTLGPEYSD